MYAIKMNEASLGETLISCLCRNITFVSSIPVEPVYVPVHTVRDMMASIGMFCQSPPSVVVTWCEHPTPPNQLPCQNRRRKEQTQRADVRIFWIIGLWRIIAVQPRAVRYPWWIPVIGQSQDSRRTHHFLEKKANEKRAPTRRLEASGVSHHVRRRGAR